jgi:hypothetical protein
MRRGGPDPENLRRWLATEGRSIQRTESALITSTSTTRSRRDWTSSRARCGAAPRRGCRAHGRRVARVSPAAFPSGTPGSKSADETRIRPNGLRVHRIQLTIGQTRKRETEPGSGPSRKDKRSEVAGHAVVLLLDGNGTRMVRRGPPHSSRPAHHRRRYHIRRRHPLHRPGHDHRRSQARRQSRHRASAWPVDDRSGRAGSDGPPQDAPRYPSGTCSTPRSRVTAPGCA